MNGLPYYKRYPRDFIEGTIGLPFEVKTTYAFILDLIYMQSGKLPDDPRYIAGLLGVSTRKWASLRQQLIDHGKLAASGGYLTNYRALSELENLAKLQRKQSENASAPRKNKDLQKPRPSHTEPEPDTYRDTNVSLRVREKSAYTDEFENWWRAYPNKTGKGAAFKAWQKAKKLAGAERLFSALQRQLPSLEQAANRSDGNFCPHAATWLNQSRYDDEVSQPRGNLMSRIANGENPWTNASENVLPLSQPRLPRG